MRNAAFPGVVGALGAKIFRVRSPEDVSDKEMSSGKYLLDYDIGVQVRVNGKE